MKKILFITLGFFSIVILQNCSSSKKTGKSMKPAVVSFEKDIMPILQASCTPCHFPPGGKKEPLNSYDAVKNHFTDMIIRVKLPQTDNKFMPWKSKKPALSDSLIKVLEQWEKQSMPK